MGQWHINQECETALIRLNDALCSFEREAGREYTLILVPKRPDERIHMSENGKPVNFDIDPRSILEDALQEREMREQG